MVINTKRLIYMVKKWQKKVSAMKRRRISFPTDKGYFVVYAIDMKRFVVPLEYLNNSIFRELFKMSEEEFGLPSNGPITLPCDSAFMEYVISFLRQRRHLSENLEKAILLIFMANYDRCSTSSTQIFQPQTNHQYLVHGF
ncbi:Auxin-induced protein [Macleaya cordata]|uniref:Auxin-induced protein n=1 Tax=Macleaya cordata TaxID=56857 RepID=A0A200R049_MACCD|nr:Auxin-induced protein [Macleaya cordata]